MTPTRATTPTRTWLDAATFLPPVTGAAAIAERLLLLLHYGINWDNGWVGRRRELYWDHHLPDRVRVATYTGGADLDRWWSTVATDLESAPSTKEQRLELSVLLREESIPVLTLLRENTTALVLRTRIVAEAVQARRSTTATLTSPRRQK
ncbi:hypothetical protein CH275_09845 [Rhodococcus sp. 06-235-1A]|uniref:hypothetical protein n=1 Tax=Rhodococcus sp. 06-235-1A TaxID=2022508 RepID=UPI000B9C3547|nr:hypothetical protein [Rhodococcus sp. 06-235-1A]OZD06512.1 hypothetical protein CH275_09845 [Rhodococcus sp. 06-235-1A]